MRAVFLLSLWFFFFNYFKSSDLNESFKKKKYEFNNFLEKIDQNLLNRVQVEIKQAIKILEDEQKKCQKSEKKFLCIDGENISKDSFDKEYQFFKQITKSNISEKQFLDKYIQNLFLLKEIKKSSYDQEKINFFVKYSLIEYYLKNWKDEKLQAITKSDIIKFYSENLSKIKKYSLKKNYSEIKQIFENQKLLEEQSLLFSSLKGKYRIFQDDEWQNNLIHKFIKKIYHQNEKDKDVYTIEYTENKKLKKLYISIALLEKALLWFYENNPSKKFLPKNHRENFLNQFLFQNLIYLHIKEKGILDQKFYINYKKFLQKQILINTYTKNLDKNEFFKKFHSFIEMKYIFING